MVWDLDGTLLDGTYLESAGQRPGARAESAQVLTELAGRGILHAIASRNPPEAAAYAQELLGHSFAAVHCGWDAKSAAISAIMAELGLSADEVAFVDDDALQRAEVSFTLPDVLVLDPPELAEAASWPQFSPSVSTDEARRRGELYAQRRARADVARAFGGSVAEFLEYCGTRVRIEFAGSADATRLHELSVRTHQFNSAGEPMSEAEFARLIDARTAGYRVVTVRLSDKFGDDGLVGGLVVADRPGGWELPLVMMSCRALGRGVIDALLTWACQAARDSGARSVSAPCVINDRNVPLRIALTGAGFRAAAADAASTEAAGPGPGARSARYTRTLDEPVHELPRWVTGPEAGQ